jgi:hypothetical protein
VTYQAPVVSDLGTLTDLTQATSIVGPMEDSLMKAIPFHHTPPSSPTGP